MVVFPKLAVIMAAALGNPAAKTTLEHGGLNAPSAKVTNVSGVNLHKDGSHCLALGSWSPPLFSPLQLTPMMPDEQQCMNYSHVAEADVG